MFRQNKVLHKEVVPLFIVFLNRLDNFVNTSNKEDIISYCQTKDVTSSWLLGIETNKVAGHSGIEEETLKKNKVASSFEIKEENMRRNRVAATLKWKKR